MTAPGITFRLLKTPTPDELAALESLYRETGWIASGESAGFLADAVKGSTVFLAAFDGTELIGMARALSDGVSDGYIQDVAVCKSRRGHGIGGELVRRIVSELRRRGVDWIGLVGAPGTENFYRSLGWIPQPDHTLWLLK